MHILLIEPDDAKAEASKKGLRCATGVLVTRAKTMEEAGELFQAANGGRDKQRFTHVKRGTLLIAAGQFFKKT